MRDIPSNTIAKGIGSIGTGLVAFGLPSMPDIEQTFRTIGTVAAALTSCVLFIAVCIDKARAWGWIGRK